MPRHVGIGWFQTDDAPESADPHRADGLAKGKKSQFCLCDNATDGSQWLLLCALLAPFRPHHPYPVAMLPQAQKVEVFPSCRFDPLSSSSFCSSALSHYHLNIFISFRQCETSVGAELGRYSARHTYLCHICPSALIPKSGESRAIIVLQRKLSEVFE